MKKVSKIMLIVFVLLSLLLLASLSLKCVNEGKELDLINPIGFSVTVDNSKMSLYTEGEGNKTLVFLSGGGTCSPILDFKSLYSTLSDKYKIVVVEKFGYGFSDITSRSRDINIILNDTRKALEIANIKGPFILVPHSMSGLEALYWAQNYPNEVEAIIGLDMATPIHYENIKFSLPAMYTLATIHQLGLTRLIPGIWKGDCVKYGTLTDEEKEQYRMLFFAKSLSKNMRDEAKCVLDNVEVVKSKPYPNIPILMIVSNGKGTGMKKEIWQECSKTFQENEDYCKIIEYDAPHYIHDYKYNEISEDIDNFIDIL